MISALPFASTTSGVLYDVTPAGASTFQRTAPVPRIERQKVRRALVVTDQYQLVLVDDGGAAVPPVDLEWPVLRTEVLLPHQPPFMSTAATWPVANHA